MEKAIVNDILFSYPLQQYFVGRIGQVHQLAVETPDNSATAQYRPQ